MDIDAQRRQKLLNLLAEESKFGRFWTEASAGAGPGDEVYIMEIEYGLEVEEEEDGNE